MRSNQSSKSILASLMIIFFLISGCGSASSGLGNSSNNNNDNSDNIPSQSINGTVTAPQSVVAASLGVARALAPDEDALPVDGATVTAMDTITGLPIEFIPSTTTNEDGTYVLDLSNVPEGTDLSAISIEITKEENGKKIQLSAFVSEDASEGATIDVTPETTVVDIGVRQAIFESAGDLLGKASDFDLSKRETIKELIPNVYTLLQELKITAADDIDLVFDVTSGNITYSPSQLKIIQLLKFKDKQGNLIQEAGGTFESQFTTAKDSFRNQISQIAEDLSYPENLILPELPEGFDHESYYIMIPENISLPRGTVFTRGILLPEAWDQTDLPENMALSEGFILPADLALPEGTEVYANFVFPEDYEHMNNFPISMKMHKGAEFPEGSTLPAQVEFIADQACLETAQNPSDCAYEMPNFTYYYDDGFVLPNDITFEDGFTMPDGSEVQYEEGFIMPNNVLIEGTIPPEVIAFEDGFVITQEMLNRFDEEFALNQQMLFQLDDTLLIDETLATHMLLGNAKLTQEFRNRLARDFVIENIALFSPTDFVIDEDIKNRLSESACISNEYKNALGEDFRFEEGDLSLMCNDFRLTDEDRVFLGDTFTFNSDFFNYVDPESFKIVEEDKNRFDQSLELTNELREFIDTDNFIFDETVRVSHDFVFDETDRFADTFNPLGFEEESNDLGGSIILSRRTSRK